MKTSKGAIFGGAFAAVSFWAIVCILCVVFLRNCSRPHFKTVYVAEESLLNDVEEHKGFVDWGQLQVDSLGVVHLAHSIDSSSFEAIRSKVFREEIRKGRLLTTEQMSAKITDYYDKLIDVLIALFILFSFVSYFAINSRFKKQYEEDKMDFVNEIKKSLQDSQSLHDDLINGISTRLESSLVTEEDILDLREQIKKDTENFELLASVYDELSEDFASRVEVVNQASTVGEQSNQA